MLPKPVFRLMQSLPVILLTVATLAYGAEGVAGDAEKKEKKKSPNSRVCKKVKPTGSHIGQRVCLKKKEWDAMEKAAQENLRNSTTHSRGGGVSQGG